MTSYAQGTSVSTGRTREEIERVLIRYGATGVMAGWEPTRAVIAFLIQSRQIRFAIPLPLPSDERFTHTPTGQKRTSLQAAKEHDQAVRALWRSLLLIIKAKLEAVAAGVSELEVEFFAHTVLPGGATVYDLAGPQVAVAIETGHVPALLPRSITAGS